MRTMTPETQTCAMQDSFREKNNNWDWPDYSLQQLRGPFREKSSSMGEFTDNRPHIPMNGFGRIEMDRRFSSVQFSCSVVSNSLRPHEVQHTRSPCPFPAPGVYSNSCPLSWWCHPTISSSQPSLSSCLQSFPASGTFLMSQFFASGSQSIEASALASVLPMNIQVWFPLGWTGWISLQSKGLSRVFSNTTVQKHQFFSTQLSL